MPFEPTKSQKQAIQDIHSDIHGSGGSCRLIRGDVGSSKTIIGVSLALQYSMNNLQSILIAPSKLVVHQPFNSIKEMLGGFDIPFVLLVSGMRVKQKKEAQHFLSGQPNAIVVGTSACLFAKHQYVGVGCFIVDEQHKFGVEQRNSICSRTGVKTGQYVHTYSKCYLY